MTAQPLKVSVLYGTGTEKPELPEALKEISGLKFLKQALTPETFLAQHQETPPDLVVIDLDGMSRVPEWLDRVISQLSRSRLLVCSQSRDPDFLIGLMKLKVDAFLSLPLNSQELFQTVENLRLSLEEDRLKEPFKSQIVVVTGTKGGVGITSIATNLAVALAEVASSSVLLMDMGRPFPQVGQFLDLKGEHTLADLVRDADNLDHLFLQKIIQQHKANVGVILNAPDFDSDSPGALDALALSKVFDTLRATYSWIVVDAGAWLDYLYVRLVQEADYVLLVTELSVPDLQNLKKIKGLFRRWDVDDAKIRVVVNRYEKDYTLGLRDLESILMQPAFYTLPSDYASLIEAINQGATLAEVAPRSKLWHRIRGLANALIVATKPRAEARPGLLRRLFQKG